MYNFDFDFTICPYVTINIIGNAFVDYSEEKENGEIVCDQNVDMKKIEYACYYSGNNECMTEYKFLDWEIVPEEVREKIENAIVESYLRERELASC